MVDASESTEIASTGHPPTGTDPIDPIDHGASVLRIVTDRQTIVVATLAVAVRLAWVAKFARTPTGLSDPVYYDLSARSIAAGDGYRNLLGNITAYYPPGYSYSVAAVYRLADIAGLDGRHPHVIGVVQSLLWGVTVFAVIIVGHQVGGRQCGVSAGVVIALWPSLISYAGVLLSESLFVALFASTLAALSTITSRSGDADGARGDTLHPPVIAFVAVGLLVGTMVMVRPQSVLAIPIVALSWWWTGFGIKNSLALVAACAIGATVFVVPWAMRNERQMGEPVLISTNSGDNLCIGYNAQATGAFGLYAACETGEISFAGPEAELRRSKENRRRAIEYIREEPASIPLLAVKKLWATYRSDSDALRASESFGGFTIMSPGWRRAWLVATEGGYLLIAGATLIGTVLALARIRRDGRRTHPRLVMLLGAGVPALVVPMLFFGDPRFKVSSAPVFAVLAGLAIAHLIDSRQADLGSDRVSVEEST